MVITVEEVSQYLKVSKQSVRTLGRTGVLTRIYPVPRKLCFEAKDVRNYVKGRGMSVTEFDKFFNYKNDDNEALSS